MTIQSISGALAYQAAGRVALQNSATKFAYADPIKNALSVTTADRVTLSDAGKALVETEKGTTQPRTAAQDSLLRSASSDRESAEKLAKYMANTPSAIAWDITDSLRNGGPVTKLATSGRNIDDEFVSQFTTEASVIDAQRRAIYESETSKGTDPVQILAKMIDFTNSHASDTYREATGEGYQR